MPDKEILSAGLAPVLGHSIEKNAASLLEANGYDSNDHKPRKLDGQLISEVDLVLVMQKEHQYSIMKRYPSASGKVMLLGQWFDQMEIQDPFMKSPEAFSHVFNQIEKSCTRWVEKL